MSHSTVPYRDCPALQGDLDSMWANCLTAREEVPLIMWLTSGYNTEGVTIKQLIGAGGGKIRTVEVIYQPRVSENEVGTAIAYESCPSGSQAGDQYETYDINLEAGVSYTESFSYLQLAKRCQDNSQYFQERLSKMMDAVVRKLESLAWTQLAGLGGAFASNDKNFDGSAIAGDVKTIAVKTAGGVLNVQTATGEMRFSAQQANFCGNGAVFGTRPMTLYMNAVEVGCCSDAGIDVGAYQAKHGFLYFDSYRVTAVGNENSVMMLDKGAVQLLTANLYEGGFNTKTDSSYVQSTLRDPKTGLVFDYFAKDDCGKLVVRLSLPFEVIGLPDDLFFAGDRLLGVNGVQEFLIVTP